MPRRRVKKQKLSSGESGNWQTQLTSRILKGEAVPVISNSLGNDLVLGGHQKLVKSYAENFMFRQNPFSLPYLIQFRQIMDDAIHDRQQLEDDYLNFVKNQLFDIAEAEQTPQSILDEIEDEFDDLSFSEFSKRLGYPKFNKMEGHPLVELARLKIPLYITTSYHDFIEKALKHEGKEPQTEICRWHQTLEGIPSLLESGYTPSVHEPLVYHLHGFEQFPNSLVLTEDDHLEFLVAISQRQGQSGTDAIHSFVRGSMVHSMILLGYDLSQWDFRTIFWGLIKQRSTLPLSVSIQIPKVDAEKEYVQRYLGNFKFNVFWGDIHEYVGQLYQGATA